ncbi:hypothetical protein [Parasitella parasitica]|uniref:Uncharacterized protein n=1 Tax=Parasitella parasitica TaxID=35722 RepID=A0A0B7MUR5_9FUNG|nr:hypothetical protein [Parasitella parasitica]
MALSSKKQNPPGAPVPGSRSYADAASNHITTTPQSLMHREADHTCFGTPTNTQLRSIKTRIWRHARTVNGYFLDISKIRNMTDQQHLIVLNKQYKAINFHGVKTLGKTNQRYIEIYPNETIAERLLNDGVV